MLKKSTRYQVLENIQLILKLLKDGERLLLKHINTVSWIEDGVKVNKIRCHFSRFSCTPLMMQYHPWVVLHYPVLKSKPSYVLYIKPV